MVEALFRLELGTGFRSYGDFEAAFSAPDLRISQCQDGLNTVFNPIGFSPAFMVSLNDPLKATININGLSADQQKTLREYFYNQIVETLPAVLPLIGPRAAKGLFLPSPVGVRALSQKLDALDHGQMSDVDAALVSELANPLNAGLVARAAGYAVGTHSLYVLTKNARFDPSPPYATAPPVSVLSEALKVARISGAQQRMVVGDVLLPTIAFVYRTPALDAAAVESIKAWKESGWLPSAFPADLSKEHKGQYRAIRDNLLVALTLNQELRENLLTWELRSTLESPRDVRRIRIALGNQNFIDLPTVWTSQQGVHWAKSDHPAMVQDGWAYRFAGAKRSPRKCSGQNCRPTYQSTVIALPPVDELLIGRLWLGPSLGYLETLESSLTRELASYDFDKQVQGKPDLEGAVTRLLGQGIDPMAL